MRHSFGAFCFLECEYRLVWIGVVYGSRISLSWMGYGVEIQLKL